MAIECLLCDYRSIPALKWKKDVFIQIFTKPHKTI